MIVATPQNPFSLAQWRRDVAELYAYLRQSADDRQAQAWVTFCDRRDALFNQHPDSPLSLEQRANFSGLDYYSYDPTWRLLGSIDENVTRETFEADLGTGDPLRYTRVGRVHFEVQGQMRELSVYWIEGYGGGLFLPFRDGTSRQDTYGGGRYLYDTIKGADLGVRDQEMVLDFNYAYNPSCAYNARWICPLSPRENWLSVAIEAGEKRFAL
jgi:uncharacterized protein (DUF1684 family)